MTAPGSVIPVRAILSAGEIETEYLRGGHGRVVILVVTRELRHPLFVALASGCRVIMPVATTPAIDGSASPSSWSGWLHDFLEGLGSTSVTLVVADPACQEAVRFVEEHPTQIERLVLLTRQAHLFAASIGPTHVLDLDHSDLLVAEVAAILRTDLVRSTQ
jgi:hypothetical protein